MCVRSFQNNFWCSEEKHGLFLQILQMLLFHMWHNLDSYRFMLLVDMYFGDKESISLDVDFLYKVFKYLFLYVLAQWYNFSKSYCS